MTSTCNSLTPAASTLTLLVDRERVLQVLSNLIGNALKFTPPGGHVTLSVERQDVMARFVVRDTGITYDRGLHEAPLDKLVIRRL